ncbi:MAG: RNA polymerase sigma factor [Chloroflexi bacterium]|nr:MAG: RNA polymerase sigma factor [Chloroflexota bacterium]
MHDLAVNQTPLGLVSAARAGDREAFDDLVGVQLEAGYRVALAILRDPDEARDAVQEAAFKAWSRLGQLRDGRAARPWFLTIVANQCRSVRRGKWWSVVRLPSLDRMSADFEISSAESADLQRGLARLSAEDRLPLFLHFYLDLPLEEVGVVLGLSPAGAKTRVYRAARKLRPGLELD